MGGGWPKNQSIVCGSVGELAKLMVATMESVESVVVPPAWYHCSAVRCSGLWLCGGDDGGKTHRRNVLNC